MNDLIEGFSSPASQLDRDARSKQLSLALLLPNDSDRDTGSDFKGLPFFPHSLGNVRMVEPPAALTAYPKEDLLTSLDESTTVHETTTNRTYSPFTGKKRRRGRPPKSEIA
jgi:hypothetical protein